MNELEFLDSTSGPIQEILKATQELDDLITKRMNSLTKAALPKTNETSGFVFGSKSEANLQGIKPDLARCARMAITICAVDFMVYDGLRTGAQQKIHVKNGTSKTMNSKHRRQPDGFGHALDLVPFIGGIPKWDWHGCYAIALAMDTAATAFGVANHIVWGAAWDRTLADYGGNVAAYKAAVEDYAKRHPGPDFLDGPHFEWK